MSSARPESIAGGRRDTLRIVESYLPLVGLSVVWGLAFDAISLADELLSPVNLTLLRWFIAGVGYFAILPIFGKTKTKFERGDLPRLAVVAFANVPMYHLSLNFGETTVSAGVAGLLVALGPVFIVLLSRISLKEHVGRRLTQALVIATAGAVLISIPNLGGPAGSVVGIFEVVTTALAYAIFAVLSKPLVSKYGALPIAIRAGIIGTIMLVPLVSPSFVTQVSALPADGWLAVLYLSILSTVLGYSVFYVLVSRANVSRLSVQLYLIPIVSVVGGILLLGQGVTVFTLAGGAGLLFAVGLATQSKPER
ncbi:MAG TPA: EamA family transporter [Nitrososphaerales archaeon]|nr:EamA family transporter [Nitrososphaerales archaeon]